MISGEKINFIWNNTKILKKVIVAEKQRNSKRGPKSWYDLRTLKKLKLAMKDKLNIYSQ